MTFRAIALAAAGLCLAAASLPGGMSVAQFLARAHAVQAQGAAAARSPDLKLLQNEMVRVAKAYRASPAGRPPQSCPPPPGKGHITAPELIGDLNAIPVAQRGMSMDAAFTAIMKRKYPCRKR